MWPPAQCPWPQVPGLETQGLCLLSSPGDPVCCHRPAAVPGLFQKEAVTENFASLATVQGCWKVCVRTAARSLSDTMLPLVDSEPQTLGL